MNEELKQQAHKEFKEKFTIDGNRWIFFDRDSPEPVIDFIDSLIDKTVQMTEERIVERLEQEFGDWDIIEDGTNPAYITQIGKGGLYSVDGFIDELISLITNKSDINKAKE